MSAIVFENVSKRFILHHDKARSFQDLAIRTLRRQNGNGSTEDFWALRDVSFEVPQGQTVGLIGANGAGKSTALKLIARIYEPTSGKIKVKGRINALIELSAGFHEELTGRENIYLSASLLGLNRAEIQKHFDEIVAFSELEQFLDTQVKRYSSGMHVRLGFAIASCIESDILLVDEVLAVGDANFQRKCVERIADIRERGTTIFYVTHSMPEIERSCERALLLVNGRIIADGPPRQVIEQYTEKRQEQYVEARKKAPPPPPPELIFNVEYMGLHAPSPMRSGEACQMEVTVRNQSPETWRGINTEGARYVSVSYHWLDRFGNMHTLLGPGTPLPHDLPPGESVTLQSPVLPPNVPGPYRLEVDMLFDGRGWSSRHGCRGPNIPVQVLPAGKELKPRQEAS